MRVTVPTIALLANEFTPGGRKILARFDAELAGLRLRRCTIVEDGPGELVAYPPMGKGLRLIEDETRAAFQVAALAAFEAMVEASTSRYPRTSGA